jgi:hypothetical protein
LKGLVGEHKKAGGYKSKKEFRQKLCDQIIVSKGRLNNRKIFLTTAKLKEFKKTYEPAILEVAKDIFNEHITGKCLSALIEFCFEVYRREWPSSYETGLVVAGFGSDEFFPSVVTYMIDGKHNNVLRAWKDDHHCHNINDANASDGVILPFAQSDVALLFLDGIIRSHLRWLNRLASFAFGRKV